MNTVTESREMAVLMDARPTSTTRAGAKVGYLTWLLILFLLALPLVNPWVRGDGVGYYAFARALLIGHNLRFENDWESANPSFRQGRLDKSGHILPQQFTRTGHLDNHFTVGPAILWSPFLLLAHGAVLLADRLGAHIAADGYSRPYVVSMALATAAYGFCALLLAFDLARHYVDERWAFLATIGIWFASSLPVYMYFNPSWSHAHSAFTAALFFWYWHRTRPDRSLAQWLGLALLAGLMMNVYYPNVILLAVPAIEAISNYRDAILKTARTDGVRRAGLPMLMGAHALFGAVVVLALAPTFITRWIIYGGPFETGYPSVRTWSWASPRLGQVSFSADHGLLTWTPILIPALVGLFLLLRSDRLFASGVLLSFGAFYYFIASYPDWDGLSSFGNRFFVSFTPIFVIGLAVSLREFARRWRGAGSFAAASVIALLIVWNLSFIFQWGTQMVPARGPIAWGEMVHNQFSEVPRRVTAGMQNYFLRRSSLMQQIENRDLQRQKTP